MPPLITNLNPTTELDAVNAILASIGEAPVADLNTIQQQDVDMILQILREQSREVQELGWKFNTEFELPIAKAATVAWTDPDGTAFNIDVYTPPANLASFKVSPRADQAGLDLALRPPRVLAVGTYSMLFYDRARNRDGFKVGERSKLYLDLVWYFAFEAMPAAARRYITMKAARVAQKQILGSGEASTISAEDEFKAKMVMQRDPQCKPEDHYNVFQSAFVNAHLGGRPLRHLGFGTPRRYWK